MKRNDVSNPGPDTRYPAHERKVILWLDSGKWIEGWFDEEAENWIDACSCRAESDVIAWSDPTEPESAEPVAWMRSQGTGSPVVTAKLLKEWPQYKNEYETPLYATPPDTAAVMRQAPIGRALAMRVLQSDLYRQLDDTERAECDALIHDHIAALRGAIGGV